MNYYLQRHLHSVMEVPQRLRETMSGIGALDDLVQALSARIDTDIDVIVKAKQRYDAQFGTGGDPEDQESPQHRTRGAKKARTMKAEAAAAAAGAAKTRKRGRKRQTGGSSAASEESPAHDDWRTQELRDLQEFINYRIDLVKRMSTHKHAMSQYAKNLLDVNIRRLDVDLERMERSFNRRGITVPVRESESRKRRRAAEAAEEANEPPQQSGLPSVRPSTREDPDEPVYCICSQVAYGKMVGCDNPSCKHGKWFHFGCVKITEKPLGRWLCPGCKRHRRRSRRLGGLAAAGKGSEVLDPV